jgi:hypothetical protein
MLTPGRSSSVAWSVGGNRVGEIVIVPLEETLLLVYRARSRGEAWHHQKQVVSIITTATAFCGRRRWFACPQCARPCRVLLGNGRFLQQAHLRAREEVVFGPPTRCWRRGAAVLHGAGLAYTAKRSTQGGTGSSRFVRFLGHACRKRNGILGRGRRVANLSGQMQPRRSFCLHRCGPRRSRRTP